VKDQSHNDKGKLYIVFFDEHLLAVNNLEQITQVILHFNIISILLSNRGFEEINASFSNMRVLISQALFNNKHALFFARETLNSYFGFG
jgi:hypothetical protein